ncbi:MAG: hypothetical protein AB7S48_13595 [Bacteroidales bacterium]
MVTNLQTKSASRAFPISFSTTAQILLLLIVGFVATWLHYKFRIPLRMPGRHGLEFMLLVMGARYLSSLRLATSITIAGSILTTLIPGFGFTDPIMPYIYVGMGAFIDFAWYSWRKQLVWIPVIALLGGLTYTLIPLVRIVFSSLTGYFYGSLATGFMLPIFTHFIFGFIGALAGVGAASGLKRLKK